MRASFSILFLLVTHPAFSQTLPDGVSPLSGTSPLLAETDLSVIDPLIERAQVVALGESAHGSKAFIQMRHRLVQYLVKNKAYRTIFWENPTFKTFAVNDYVIGKTNDRTEALKAFTALEKNQEFWNLIEWIRAENQTRADSDKINLRGFDIWDDPWVVKDTLVHAFRTEFDVSIRKTLKLARQYCFAFQYSDWATFMKSAEYLTWQKNKKFDDERYFGCMNAVHALEAHVVKNRERLEKEIGRSLVIQALMALHLQWGYEQDLHFISRDFRQAETARDHAQARIFKLARQLDGADRKAVLLAHNLHISKAQSKVELQGWNLIPSMGEWLRKDLKDAYKAFAITGFEVASTQAKYPLPTSPESLDLNLKAYGETLFVNTQSSWIASRPLWFIQLEEIPNGEKLDVQENFDGVFFMAQSPAASALQ